MQHSWLILGTGIFFCCSGIYLFLKNVFEEGRSIRWSILIMLMGVVMIALSMATLYGLNK